ncbi:MAG: hypothetical protein AAF242_02690, partial [Bacteroidota bacterium]
EGGREVQNNQHAPHRRQLLKENGLFEDDEKISLRLMFYQENELTKDQIKLLAKEMLSSEANWKQGKRNYIYNFQNGGTGIIPING